VLYAQNRRGFSDLTINAAMKTRYILITACLALLASCDQQQNQLLTMREELMKQMQAKDKSISDLQQQIGQLQTQNTRLQDDLLRAKDESNAPEKIADVVTKKAEEQVAAALGEIKTKLDAIESSMKNIQIAAAAAPPAPTPAPQQMQAPSHPAPQPVDNSIMREKSTTDPNRKKFKFDF
jgi:multidrug resistance efflux pump